MAKHGEAEGHRVDHEHPAGADGDGEHAGGGGADQRAPLNEAELSATAFDRLSSVTSSETKVCRAGASMAATTPRAEGEEVDVPEFDDAGHRDDAEPEGEHAHQGLRER